MKRTLPLVILIVIVLVRRCDYDYDKRNGLSECCFIIPNDSLLCTGPFFLLTMLSNLLWAAFGVNRPKSGKRTAPSAGNRQEVDIYVATARGLYVFDAKALKLDPHQKIILTQPVGYPR